MTDTFRVIESKAQRGWTYTKIDPLASEAEVSELLKSFPEPRQVLHMTQAEYDELMYSTGRYAPAIRKARLKYVCYICLFVGAMIAVFWLA